MVAGWVGATSNLASHILFVNMFQVGLSVIYLFYNNCITCQAVAREWSHFMDGSERKSLRVSSHSVTQRETYMLSLPWIYAVPLLGSFAFLHFLVSQSVFLISTKAYTAGPNEIAVRVPSGDSSGVGFSSMGILMSLVTGTSLYVFLLISSLRKYPHMPAYLPAMATRTAFISAACHRPAPDKDAHQFPLKFMAVGRDADGGGGEAPQRVVYSTDRKAEAPVVGLEYEQPVPVGEWDDWKRLRGAFHFVLVDWWRVTGYFGRRMAR